MHHATPIEEKMFYFQDVLRLPHVILQDAYFSKRCILQDAVFVCHGLYYDKVGKRQPRGLKQWHNVRTQRKQRSLQQPFRTTGVVTSRKSSFGQLW